MPLDPINQPGLVPGARPLARRTRVHAGLRLPAVALLLLVLSLTACDRGEVARGAALYEAHCQTCHGPQGEGQNPAKPWGSLRPDLEGFVAPALDGRGHCWFHTDEEMARIIAEGTGVEGSPMPAWQRQLDAQKIRALVLYIHSLWPRRLRNYAEQFQPEELKALRTQAEVQAAPAGTAPPEFPPPRAAP